MNQDTAAARYEVRDGAAWITLNRPDNRNALSAALVNALYAGIGRANDDAGVRCIVITGAGSAFCAGADLKSPPGSTIDGSADSVPYPDVLVAIQDSPKPVIAAVNGHAFAGGLGLVGAADIAIAVEDATFSFSEVRLGLIPAVISVVCLPKIGRLHGTRLFVTGARFSGAQAVEYGLVNRAVPAERLVAEVEAEIAMIGLGGPNAVIENKRLVREVLGRERDEALALTSEWSVRMFNSEEGLEGMAAFADKRPPRWAAPE